MIITNEIEQRYHDHMCELGDRLKRIKRVFKLTGVKISVEAFDAVLVLQRKAVKAPAITVDGKFLPDVEVEAINNHVDRLAVAAGLPEPEVIGEKVVHYGIDPQQREFTKCELE